MHISEYFFTYGTFSNDFCPVIEGMFCQGLDPRRRNQFPLFSGVPLCGLEVAGSARAMQEGREER